jgi:CheY-like chemotaxis protein
MRLAAEAKGVSLTLAVDERPLTILGDPTRLQQILWNLLSNAVKFTPAGGKIGVELEAGEKRVNLSVTDTGEGIEPAFLPHVFERFRQADGSTARRTGGLGLGLAIARHLVELHDGQINVESAGKDRGTTFSVSLPLAGTTDAAAPPFAPPPPVEIPALRLDGVRVLVVEDEADARELVGALLGSRGARVELTASAAEACAKLQDELPDVILSDIGMPDVDGYAFLRKLRSSPREQGGAIPAVALTAYASAQDRRRALEAGYSHHLPKPVDTEELVRVLGALARRKNPEA